MNYSLETKTLLGLNDKTQNRGLAHHLFRLLARGLRVLQPLSFPQLINNRSKTKRLYSARTQSRPLKFPIRL
jgi:hypothetical protein